MNGSGNHPKIGIQSIIWGRNLPHLKEMLDLITSAGFNGIEFSQIPEILKQAVSGKVEGLQQLLRTTRGSNKGGALRLVGLAGGQLADRLEYCEVNGHPSPQLFDDFTIECRDWGIGIDKGMVERIFEEECAGKTRNSRRGKELACLSCAGF